MSEEKKITVEMCATGIALVADYFELNNEQTQKLARLIRVMGEQLKKQQ